MVEGSFILSMIDDIMISMRVRKRFFWVSGRIIDGSWVLMFVSVIILMMMLM